MPQLFGRVEDFEETERIVNTFRSPFFVIAAALSSKGKDTFLWKAEEYLTGTVHDPHNQTIGDCTSHGWGEGIDVLRFIRLILQDYDVIPVGKGPGSIDLNNPLIPLGVLTASRDALIILKSIHKHSAPHSLGTGAEKIIREEFIFSATEPIYAGARVQIGKGKCGVGDGAVGAWICKWVMDYGVVPRLSYSFPDGSVIDLTKYNGNLAKKWGHPSYGCPESLVAVARDYPIKDASLVTSYSQARDAIAVTKSPVVICSNQGFEPFVRDKQGFVRPGGIWNHCMVLIGVSDNPIRPGCVCRQSWGKNQPSGPLNVTLPHGLELVLYDGMFFIDADVVDRILKQNDSYVISDMVGYPAKELNLEMI